ncbi:MAG TPA: LacI family DNA-binding transcriptional regulator [Candidatus Dormibacteraeota bacterium]|nr:LacI family DNA-binding transcriptional regulator [Candidatus Dormibacteraeota bacterium]
MARPPSRSSTAGELPSQPRVGRVILTLEDVAYAAGVHYSTVSRALDPAKAGRVNASTRAHVESVARRLGYQRDMVASGLRRGRTQTIAVIVADLGNPFMAPVLRSMANRLEESGLMSLISETQDDSARLHRILNHVISRRVDAIITTAARLGDGSTLLEISRQGIPLVLAVRNVPSTRLPACTDDDVAGGRLAAQHLLSLGHQRVAQLRGPADVSSFVDRAWGFSEAITAGSAREFEVGVGSPTLEEGIRLMNLLLDTARPLPSAIFAHNDLMALGALAVMRQRGISCPEQISVIGYNDSPQVDRVQPALTTVRQPAEEIGRMAAEMTVALLESPRHPPPSRSLRPTLVVRESTAVPLH